jgi:hypothetical protein
MSLSTALPRRRVFASRQGGFAAVLSLSLLLTGCARFHHDQHEHVYVAARQVYLHDRVAAVSNRVGLVTNGQALEVVERGKRFVKVRTPKGEVGWLEEHAIIDDKLYAQFQDLNKKHAQDPAVATGELRDDLYLHVLPGRETPHFLLIAGNAKVQLLQRGTIAKSQPGSILPSAKAKPAVTAAKPAVPSAPSIPSASSSSASPATPVPAPVAPVPVEDWWLVRDSAGHTGWLLAGRIDVDVPEEIGEYAEGQRMIGAYPIAKVTDDGTGKERKKSDRYEKKAATGKSRGSAAADADAPAAPVAKEITEFVTFLSPPHGGLPYDFDQVRVFTWSLNHHRYETGYRLHGIKGYLPVRISQETVNGQTYPVFSFQIASGPDISVDPDTGVTRPVAPRTLSFRLEGNMVRRAGADQGPIVLTRDPEQAAKAKTASKSKKKR